MVVEIFEQTLNEMYASFIAQMPGIIFALITLAIGYVIGRVVGVVIERILTKVGIDKIAKGVGAFTAVRMSHLFGIIARWTIYIVFIIKAVEIAAIAALTEIVNTVVAFIPGVVGAIVIMLTSYVIAAYVQQIIGKKEIYTDILGKMLFFLIIYIGLAAALPLVALPTRLIDYVLLVIIASIGAGLAIALGLGLKDTVADLAADYRKKFRKKKR